MNIRPQPHRRAGLGTTFAQNQGRSLKQGRVGNALAPFDNRQPVDNRPPRRFGEPRGGFAFAADQSVKIGIDLPLTGADANEAELIKDGAMMAIDEANAKAASTATRSKVLLLDDGTATAGQYDPGAGGDERPQDGRRQDGGRPRSGRR